MVVLCVQQQKGKSFTNLSIWGVAAHIKPVCRVVLIGCMFTGDCWSGEAVISARLSSVILSA